MFIVISLSWMRGFSRILSDWRDTTLCIHWLFHSFSRQVSVGDKVTTLSHKEIADWKCKVNALPCPKYNWLHEVNQFKSQTLLSSFCAVNDSWSDSIARNGCNHKSYSWWETGSRVLPFVFIKEMSLTKDDVSCRVVDATKVVFYPF